MVPCQAPGPMAALWAPPSLSYSAMVSSTETTASTSVAGVTPPSHLPPRAPAIEAMDMLPAPTTENLLATAWHLPGPQATGSATSARCPWSPSDET